MGSTTIRVDEDVYDRLREVKRDEETFSEALDRILTGGSLLDLVGFWSGETVDEVKAVITDADATSVADADQLADRSKTP